MTFRVALRSYNPYLQAQQLQVQTLGAGFFFLAFFFAFSFAAMFVFTNVILVYPSKNVKHPDFSTAFEANFFALA